MKTPASAINEAVFPGDWSLYRLKDDGTRSFLWPEFRLMLPPDTPAKHGQTRRYCLAWSLDEQRLRKDADSLRLERERPDLAAMVAVHLSLNHGPDWMQDSLYSEEEAAAERVRLKALRAKRRAAKAGAP